MDAPPFPYDPAAEAGALACILSSDNGHAESFLEKLDESLFYDIRHVEIFRMMLGLQFDHQTIDSVSLVQRLKDTNRIVRAGGLEYLHSLPDQTPSAISFESFLGVIRDRAARRKLILHSDHLRVKALDLAHPLEITQRSIVGIPIGDLQLAPSDDPTELLRHRFLCQKMSLLFIGSTGKGKSSALLQALALWSLGKDFFGITPTRPLRSVYIQAENDDGDIAAIRDGICTGLEFTQEERALFFSRVLVFTETALTGKRFCNEIVKPLLAHHGPDLFAIDPALSYLGGDSKEQRDVGAFLRNYLNPLLFDFNCAAVVNHHTNKIGAEEQKRAAIRDFAYSGSGSAEWANWARAILTLEATKNKGVFRLHAAKRGQKIGWKDDDEKVSYSKLIAHSLDPKTIFWRTPAEDELPEGSNGRPRSVDLDKILSPLLESSLSASKWQKAVYEEFNVSRTSFYRAVEELEAQGRILKSKINRHWTAVSGRQSDLPKSAQSTD